MAKARTSPTQRSLKELRRLGYQAQIVERWNQYAKVRQDLFGGIDVLAVRHGECLGVQTTSGSHHSARVLKLRAEPKLRAWVDAGCLLEVWSWGLKGQRGKRKLYELRRERIEYFTEATKEEPF